jgi:hypothetical protein
MIKELLFLVLAHELRQAKEYYLDLLLEIAISEQRLYENAISEQRLYENNP